MAFYWLEGGTKAVREILEAPASPSTEHAKKNPYTQPTPGTPARKLALLAGDIMRSPVRTLPESATFEEARLLFRQRRFRHVPILNAAGSLSGIISDRDVLREAAQIGEKVQGWVQELVNEQKTVVEFMTKRILVGTPSTEIRQIAKAMFEERIGSMPIIDAKNRLTGIITRSDILRTLVTQAPIELWI